MPGVITTDLVVLDSAEAVTNWLAVGTWGAAPAASADIYLELSNAINARASAAAGPVERYAGSVVATPSNLDLSTLDRHIYFWVKCFSLPAMNTRAKGGIRISISKDVTPTRVPPTLGEPWVGPSNSKNWFVTGKDFEPESGWICYVIDPVGAADYLIGSPDMALTNRAGIGTDALLIVGGGSVKPFPTMWDRIAYGSSLTIKEGTSGAPVTFEDIYAADSLNANQYGILRKAVGLYFGAGKLLIGATNQTAIAYFKDTNQVLVWQDFRQNINLYEIKMAGAGGFATTFKLGNYSEGLASAGCTIRGSGLNTRRLVNPVIVSGGTGYTVGNILTIVGGTGLAATVKVIAVSGGVVTDLKVETMGSYSTPPTGTLSTTGAGSGCTCTMSIVGGSVWMLTADAANQTTLLYACNLSEMKSAALAATSEIRGCSFDNCGEITAGGATITGNTFQNLRTVSPISASYQIRVTTTTPVLTTNKFVNCATALLWDRDADTNGKLDGCTFISGGTGHAIEFGTNTPGDPTEITLTNVIFTDYGANETTDAAIYNNSGKHLIIKYAGGNEPTYRNGSGATTTIKTSVTLKMTVKKEDGTPILGALAYIDNNDETPFIMNTTTDIYGVASTAYSGSPVTDARWRVRIYGYKNFKILLSIGGENISLPVTLVADPQQT